MLRFLFLITVLAGSAPPPLIAIDEPEAGLHPSMLPIVAEYATEAANHTQVILTTHSPQLLNAFSHRADITTLMEWRDGQTYLRRLPEEKLAHWLEDYQLGELFVSGELEGIA
jgi:predicted ATPase